MLSSLAWHEAAPLPFCRDCCQPKSRTMTLITCPSAAPHPDRRPRQALLLSRPRWLPGWLPGVCPGLGALADRGRTLSPPGGACRQGQYRTGLYPRHGMGVQLDAAALAPGGQQLDGAVTPRWDTRLWDGPITYAMFPYILSYTSFCESKNHALSTAPYGGTSAKITCSTPWCGATARPANLRMVL